MLDTFEILTTSGVVLWSRTYAPVNPSVVNNFIADTFIEEKGGSATLRDAQSAATNPTYKSDQHTLKWTMVKELGVIFVVRTHSSARSNPRTWKLTTPYIGRVQIPPTPQLGGQTRRQHQDHLHQPLRRAIEEAQYNPRRVRQVRRVL